MSGPDSPDALLTAYLALSHIIAVPEDDPRAPLPGEAPEETPRFYVARAAWGATRAFIRPDTAPALRLDLESLPPERALDDPDAVARLFARHAFPYVSVWIGRTSRFPDDRPDYDARGVAALAPEPDWYGAAAPEFMPDEAEDAARGSGSRQFAIIEDELVVATCESSRESQVAAEAWTRTLPAYRGRGYATRVTAAWARDARRRGREPFYSHHRDNLASAAVARALGLIPFLADVGFL